MSIALSLVGGVLLIGLIIAANGYFVAQEFSYMAVDRSRLNALAAQGDRSAKRTLQITDRTSFMLSGAQLGITVTGLMVGYAAEPLIGSAVGELLGGVGVPTGTGIAIGTVGTLVVATFAQMLFGELFPKNLSIARPYAVAQRLSGSTLVYMRAFGWVIRFFDAASNGLLRLLRIEPVHDVAHSANLHDLQRIVSASKDAGELPPELSLVLDRMIDFPERDVDHALVPRSRVDVFDAGTDLREVLQVMEGGHSRYPVLDAHGEVVGVVHLVDVIEALRPCEDHAPEGPTVTVGEVSREATVLPTLMRLPDALAAMTEAGDQLACVVDEYGGFAGIITLEDLVEEVVGEITDEHDGDEEPHLVPDASARAWTVRGDAPLDEVEREVGAVLPRGDFETVAGMVIAEHGALPAEGDTVEVHLPPDPLELAHSEHPPERTLRAEVLEVEHHVPTHLRLELVGAPLPGEDDTDQDHTDQNHTDQTEEVSR
ncbi:hemolysin family protein [Nocardioides aquaticus]|nr:hemolysin family protein [Nocardioides aquaticus]